MQMEHFHHQQTMATEQNNTAAEMQMRAHEHETGRQDAREQSAMQLQHEEREGAESRKHEAQQAKAQAKAKAATAAKPKAKP